MARIWDLIFFPPEGMRNSPVDILKGELQPNEQALVMRRLNAVAQLNTYDWHTQQVKKINDVYQGKAGAIRYYFGIAGRFLVVSHICRKQGRKANPQDLYRAESNFYDYLEG